jgi:hypothetical protein
MAMFFQVSSYSNKQLLALIYLSTPSKSQTPQALSARMIKKCKLGVKKENDYNLGILP